jgi:hypothetical protein
MPFRNRPQAITPAHWSKDFVEHLRTVHLALIATAAALVVGSAAMTVLALSVVVRPDGYIALASSEQDASNLRIFVERFHLRFQNSSIFA